MYDIPSVTVGQVPDPLPEGVRVLDVREPQEWAAGHIEGAAHIPLHDLPSRLVEVPEASQLLVVCKVGARSAQAVAWLSRNGHEAVNLEGGMVDWSHAGRSMVRDDGGEPFVG
jgi:rhodanese-related sulfurtransferase